MCEYYNQTMVGPGYGRRLTHLPCPLLGVSYLVDLAASYSQYQHPLSLQPLPTCASQLKVTSQIELSFLQTQFLGTVVLPDGQRCDSILGSDLDSAPAGPGELHTRMHHVPSSIA